MFPLERPLVTFYHDIEQNAIFNVDPAQCREVTARFLAVEARYGVAATYNVVGRFFREQPALVADIAAGGHELAFHSYHHPHVWQPEIYAEEVRLCREVAPGPVGYRSPRSQWDGGTLDALAAHGFRWSAEDDAADAPYFIREELVRLPVAGDDWRLYGGRTTVEEWVAQFARLLTERRYVAFGTHDFSFCFRTEERFAAYERLLRLAQEAGALVVTFGRAQELFLQAGGRAETLFGAVPEARPAAADGGGLRGWVRGLVGR